MALCPGTRWQPPWVGDWQAVADATHAGWFILYQDFTIPADASAELSLVYWYDNYLEDWPLDQRLRIDIMDPAYPVWDTEAGVMLNLLMTDYGDPYHVMPTPMNVDLSIFAGLSIRLRIFLEAEVFFFLVGIDAVSVDAQISAVDDGVLVLQPGEEIRLLPNVPNPFNPRTALRFALARNSRVELSIFDVAGHKVKTLVSGDLEALPEHEGGQND